MLLQLALNYLSIAFLHPLQVFQRLVQLATSVQDHDPCRFDALFDVLDDLRHDLDLARVQVPVVDTLSAQQIMRVFHVGVDYQIVLLTHLVILDNGRPVNLRLIIVK